jgi:hypothetical protein
MAEPEKIRCGGCCMFHTPKCRFAYSSVPIKPPEPKIVHDWKEFLGALYDFRYLKNPVPYTRIISNYDLIFAKDSACPDFEEL